MPSNIRWSKSDYAKLGRAVADFNKKVKEIVNEENQLYLPELQEYKSIKSTINTRGKLNDVLRSLKAFQKQGAENIVNVLGETQTQWAAQETQIKIDRAIKNVKTSIKFIEQKKPAKTLSKAELKSLEYKELLEDLRDLKKIRSMTGTSTYYKDLIKNLGDVDYGYLKATIFRENIESVIDSTYKDYEGYDLLKKYMKRYKSPENFYKFMNKSEIFMDIFEYYKQGDGLVYGEFDNDQQRFNYGLEELGIVDKEKQRLIKKYKKNGNDELLKKAESIESAFDLFQFLKFYK